jgi:hypothetical protein
MTSSWHTASSFRLEAPDATEPARLNRVLGATAALAFCELWSKRQLDATGGTPVEGDVLKRLQA